MSNARIDQLVREAFVFQSPNARVDQLVREAWVTLCEPPTTTANFNYIKSFPLTSGEQYTIAVSADGLLWSEDVVANPTILHSLSINGGLSSATPTVLPGSYCFSTTLDDVEYMCFSNLSYGTDIPRQYNPQPAQSSVGYTLDRISQCGPGAPPTFQATVASTSGSVPITSWSGTGSVVTFQAVNTFTAGEIIKLSGFVTSTFFNNRAFSVLGTGLSGTQFEIAFSGFSGGSDTGTATPQYGYNLQGITQPAQMSDPQDAGHFQALLWSAGPGQNSAGNVITVYYANASAGQVQDSVLVNAFNSGIATYVYISNAPFGNGTYLINSVGSGKPPGGDGTRWYFTVQTSSSNFQFFGGPDNATGFYQLTLATMVTQTPIPGLSAGDQITITGASPSQWNSTWTIANALASGVYNITQTAMTTGTATYSWSWAGSGSAIPPTAGQLVTITNTLNGNGVFNVTDATIATVSGGPSSGTFTIANFPSQTIAASPESGLAQTSGTQFQFDPGQTTLGSTTSPIFGNAAANTGLVTVVGSTNTAIGSGTRQAVVFFETRNGLKTACSSPATFTTSSAAAYILSNNIPIGPPNVIRRWIAFTSAGPNGIPGPNFYTIDAPVSYTVNNQTYLYSATYIDDNTTTSAKFTFTDAVLLAGEEIDVQGNDLFSQIELGSSAWNVAYASRMFYGLEQNKVLNFNNLSFNGGYLPNPTGNLTPLGWGIDAASNINTGTPATISAFSITSNIVTITAANGFVAGQQVYITGLATGTYLNNVTLTIITPTATNFTAAFVHGNASSADSGLATPVAVGATLIASPVFGNAYYIYNQLGSTQSQLGMIVQGAYQDAYNVPIILPNTLYSVRVTLARSSTVSTGNLVIDLTEFSNGLISGGATVSGYGATYGSFSVPLSSITQFQSTVFTGTLLTNPFTGGVPSGLLLRVYATNIGYTADVIIDRIEVFPTATPTLSTNVRVSYADNFEAFDSNTGNIGLASHNTQPAYGAFELHDQLYFLQSGSMQVTQDVPSVEPSGPNGGWGVHEVSNRVGACGIHAYDYGEEWVVTACRNGLYGFNGGQPVRIDFQQKEIWESINWNYGNTIWVRNDLPNRRILVGVPLPTPNQWLPEALLNTAPSSPNVILMWNYQGLNDFQELVSGQGLHTTMFGTLASVDMRLKFAIWNITSPYAGFITQTDLTTQAFTVCNGIGNGKIYRMSPAQLSDDGAAINSQYFTYGFVNSAKAQQFPLLGFHRKRFQMVQQLFVGTGVGAIKAYPNYILTASTLAYNTNAYTVPGGVTLQQDSQGDIIRPLNISGDRVFLRYGTNAVGSGFVLSKVIAVGAVDGKATVNPNNG